MYWGRGKASERISINFVIELNVNRDFLAYLIDIQRRRGKGGGGEGWGVGCPQLQMDMFDVWVFCFLVLFFGVFGFLGDFLFSFFEFGP